MAIIIKYLLDTMSRMTDQMILHNVRNQQRSRNSALRMVDMCQRYIDNKMCCRRNNILRGNYNRNRSLKDIVPMDMNCNTMASIPFIS